MYFSKTILNYLIVTF